MPVDDDKVVKNGVHLDLNPGATLTPAEREAEIDPIIALGARRVDVGQTGDESWTVLPDPEAGSRKGPSADTWLRDQDGNEFRVAAAELLPHARQGTSSPVVASRGCIASNLQPRWMRVPM